jgi:alpha-N-arabinofuranosidase
MACLAQLVNVIAPIVTQKGGQAIRQTIFYPLKYVTNFAKGKTLHTINTIDKFESKYGKTDYLSTAITYNENEICIFVCNYAAKNIVSEIELRSFGNLEPVEYITLTGDDIKAQNTFEKPYNVIPQSLSCPEIKNGIINVEILKYSWNMIRLKYTEKK